MQVGDLIDIKIDDRIYPMEAIASDGDDTFLFVFEDCMHDVHYMNKARASCPYQVSDMYQYIHQFNEKVSEEFLEQYEIIPNNGNYFRLLRTDEIYGPHHYSYFDIPENITASFNQVDNISYWLEDEVDPDTYACVSFWGQLRNNYADFELGVRLVCEIRVKYDNKIEFNESVKIKESEDAIDDTENKILRVVVAGAHPYVGEYNFFKDAANDLRPFVPGSTILRFTKWWYNDPESMEFKEGILYACRILPGDLVVNTITVTKDNPVELTAIGYKLFKGDEYKWTVSCFPLGEIINTTDAPHFELSEEGTYMFNHASIVTTRVMINGEYTSDTFIIKTSTKE